MLLADGLERDVALVEGLAPLAPTADLLRGLAADARTQLERSRTAAIVTLVGSTGAGKSTLLNALVGHPIAREGEDRPTTSQPVIYRPRDADLRELLEGLPGEAPRVIDYDPEVGGAAGEADSRWSGQVLVDAPDTNSVETLHREIVAALAARSDVLLIVAHRQSVAELSSARFVDLFAGRRGMIFVLNRADELEAGARDALVAQIRELARERFHAEHAPVLAVSARAAQKDPSAPGWVRLVEELRSLATGEVVGSVRRRNALGAVGSLADQVSRVAPEARRRLERVETTTNEGLASFVEDVSAAVAERAQHRSNDLAAMLWNAAAKAWDGPGGYALRAGGFATLGLGAGALIARHNPALAAGAAVGALALDRARGALREHGFQSASRLLPGAGEVEVWQHDCLSAARLAAEDLFVSEGQDLEQQRAASAAALIPDASLLGAIASRTVEEAWEELVAVDMPKAARAALPRGVPWLVDLPIYGLGAWIVYRAGVGLYTGVYIGVEMLATAAIVSAAWLFLCRTLVRRGLRGRGGRLLAGVRARIDERLARALGELGAEQRRALEPRRAALERLVGAERNWRERLRA